MRYPDLPGPPQCLMMWLRCWDNGEEPDDHPDDDKPV